MGRPTETPKNCYPPTDLTLATFPFHCTRIDPFLNDTQHRINIINSRMSALCHNSQEQRNCFFFCFRAERVAADLGDFPL